MEFQINFGCWGKVFAVPSAVVDHFIKLASETQLKILLYLLRYPEQIQHTKQIADFFRISEEQVEEAMQFWMQANILQTPEAVPASKTDFMEIPAPENKPPAARVQHSSREIKLDPAEIAAELEKSQHLKDLFTCAETICGRILNHMEQRSLLWMCSYLGMKSEVILLLLQYCVSIDKNSIAYAEAIAIRWMEEEITTTERAEKEICRMMESHTFTGKIQKMFHMNNKPTKNQQEIINRWQAAAYPMELIQYAYEITIEQIDKKDFKYMNKILESWKAERIATVEEARRLREANTASKPKGKKRTKQVSEQDLQEMDAYLSTVNRFRKD